MQSYERPLFREEQTELDLINLHDMGFHFGIDVECTIGRGGTRVPIPETIGRVVSSIEAKGPK